MPDNDHERRSRPISSSATAMARAAKQGLSSVEYELRHMGYKVLRNKPYAGGFITEHYGDPAGHFHAIQIEVNRALYMDEKQWTGCRRFVAWRPT